MVEPQKPFACTLSDCGMTFTNEDHLHVHTKKHDMCLQLGLEQKAVFAADQTPTPTRFIRNCEEVGLFQDLQNVAVNPFDEGFKRAMETKHGVLCLENAIAGAADDVLHTPQMVFPLLDPGDSALFSSTANQRNITTSRSSSDENGTIKEYETTTISKLTNEVTTISRVVGNRDNHDKTTDGVSIIKNTGKVKNETVHKNNIVKIENNVEIRKLSNNNNAESTKNIPVVVYTDTVLDATSVTKDVLLTDSSKLQVPENLPPIMSQRSLDFVVDSLDLHNNTIDKEKNHPVSNLKVIPDHGHDIKKPDIINNRISNPKSINVLRNKTINKNSRKVIIRKNKIEPKKLAAGDYEVLIKLPNGKQVRMKAVEEVTKPVNAKEVLRETLTKKAKITTEPIVEKVSVLQNVLQIPTGTLIPVTLVNQAGNPISTSNIPKVPITKVTTNNFTVPFTKLNGPIAKTNNIISATNFPQAILTKISVIGETKNKVTKMAGRKAPKVPIKVANIAPKNPKSPAPFSRIKISQPYQINKEVFKKKESVTKIVEKDTNCTTAPVDVDKKMDGGTHVNIEKAVITSKITEAVKSVKITETAVKTAKCEEKAVETTKTIETAKTAMIIQEEAETQNDDDCMIEEVSDNPEEVKRMRCSLESRCAASKRYRERLKGAMERQTEENRRLREANQRLVAEKAVLKLLITEHMKRCPNAEDLRTTQERLHSVETASICLENKIPRCGEHE